jgi:hypothetical protein
VRLITKDVGLQASDIRRGVALEQLENRTVGTLVAARSLGGFEQLAQGLTCATRHRSACRRRQLVGQGTQRRDVKRHALAARVEQDGGRRANAVTQAELVEDIGVGTGQVGDGEVAENQPLVHRFVNDPAADLLIGAQRLHARRLDRRSDQLAVDGVEVDRGPGGNGLLAEGHEYET